MFTIPRSAGCIFAELANAGRPLFPGSDVDDQIKRVGLFFFTLSDYNNLFGSGFQALGHTNRGHVARDG